mmetsp:Transcript_3661/g.4298  ORF Transcript_3661/g.4298 Transcript_3661/m.4298 type:complete len:229 (-) Transcript_3661:211-897(-)
MDYLSTSANDEFAIDDSSSIFSPLLSLFFFSSQSSPSQSTYSNLRLEPKDHVKRLHIFAKTYLLISLFFWIWAGYNTKYKMKAGKHNFDLGCISFFLSAISSFYLYLKTKNGIRSFKSIGKIGKIIVTFSHLIVMANYMLGAYMAFIVGKVIYVRFATYCIIFTFLWFGSAILSWKLMTNTSDIGIDEESDDGEEDDDDEDEEYDFGDVNSQFEYQHDFKEGMANRRF